ncbi:MAG: GGGtGRT protein [Caulobacteraceae bacterium]
MVSRGEVAIIVADLGREANLLSQDIFSSYIEAVDVPIIVNSTNTTRFQHPVVGIYKKNVMRKTRKETAL